MNDYCIDFRGDCVIEAENADEAREKFWEMVANDKPLPSNLYKIESVEKVGERVY